MKKLIILAAFVLLGLFTSSVMAAKPTKLITLIGGPMVDGATKPWHCDVHNTSSNTVDTAIEICINARNNVNPAICLPSTPEVALLPDRFYGYSVNSGVDTSGICKVTYLGQPGDILGTLCGSNGCVQLQPQ